MRERTIAPAIAKQLVADNDAMVGPGKLVWTEHDKGTLFGGRTCENISTIRSNWNMSVGTLIWVPCKIYKWADGLCDWSIEDILLSGLEPRFWTEHDTKGD